MAPVNLFKIMPHSMVGTLYHDDYIKVVKLRLKKGKRLPKHQQEGYNVFIIPADGKLTAEVEGQEDNDIFPGDILHLSDQYSFSLKGVEEESPFLYFIIPETDESQRKEIFSGKYLGCCYSDDLIRFTRYELTPEEPEVTISSPGDEIIMLCYAGEAGAVQKSTEKDHQYRFMSGDVFHFSGYQNVKFFRKENNCLLLAACLRFA